MPDRAVFFDRDGVLNYTVDRDGQPGSPRSLAEFVLYEGLDRIGQRLRDAGYRLFVVTNQPDITRGLLERAPLDQMHALLLQAIDIDEIAVCWHDDGDRCDCRKPLPGMLITLARTWGIDLGRSFMVGDSWRDAGAGAAAGCTTILLDREHNRDAHSDVRCDGLAEAVTFIMAQDASGEHTA